MMDGGLVIDTWPNVIPLKIFRLIMFASSALLVGPGTAYRNSSM